MSTISKIFVALVAFEHIYILWLEMFAWTTRGPKVFRSIPRELFEPTKALAANQGLYNGFLAAGLLWSIFITDPQWSFNNAVFFVGCVIVAALYGAYSADKKILMVQGGPAIVAMIVLWVFG